MTANPNPRYWRSQRSHYIVNFDKVGMIWLSDVSLPAGDPVEVSPGIVKVNIALERTAAAFMLHTTSEEHEQLMAAYERWLTER